MATEIPEIPWNKIADAVLRGDFELKRNGDNAVTVLVRLERVVHYIDVTIRLVREEDDD